MPQWKLNAAQEKAVLATEGRVLVLAGAGSGKTRVITYRIAHLIQNLKVEPSSILGLTFTNKAAEEMRSRLKTLISKDQAKKAHLSTFHSFCMSILRKEIQKLGYTPHFTIYDEADNERLIKNILKDTLKISTQELPPLKPIIAALSEAKNKGSKAFEHVNKPERKFFQELFERFNFTLKAYNALDFDSLLTLTLELFEKFPAVLKKYQEKYRYIMIDEYQDTSSIQYKIAEKLAANNNNLCVVGDDDQSIYAFRGAEISHILNFKADHMIKLEDNYRSAPSILEAADSVIKNNKGRHLKKLRSQKKDIAKIALFHTPTDKEEAEAVAEKIVRLKKNNHLALKDIAILYRSNNLSRQMEMALMNVFFEENGQWNKGLPYKVFGGLEFAERSEIKDIMSYLRIIANPQDKEALVRIINVPRRGISEKTLTYLTSFSQKQNLSFWKALKAIADKKNQAEDETGDAPAHENTPLKSKTLKGIVNLVEAIDEAKVRFASKTPLFETLKWFLERINYRQAIREDTKSEKAEIFKWENAEETISALSQYEEEQKDNASLADFIATTALARQNPFKSEDKNRQDRVQLMTFHRAKGLEFKACFLIGLEDHILPHEKSQTKAGIEEERRLFYVAITRAMDYLFLSMAQNRRKGGGKMTTNPSRFLKEIPKELLEISSCR